MTNKTKEASLGGANELVGLGAEPMILELAVLVEENLVDRVDFQASKYAIPLGEILDRESLEPPLEFIYSGILEGSFGIILGPAKSCKTMYCEGLGQAIASGRKEYHNLPIRIKNKKVLFISLEENWRARCLRNRLQLRTFNEAEIASIRENFIVVDDLMPQYLEVIKAKDRQLITDLIQQVQPGIVFIDSLGHLQNGQIEDSQTAQKVMKELREITREANVTLVVIHHTPKIHNGPLTINAIAGSSVIGREVDFVIGLNKTVNNDRYIKNIISRYAEERDEKVRLFRISENCTMEIGGKAHEHKLLESMDGRRDSRNQNIVREFLISKLGANDGVVHVEEMAAELVKPGTMSQATLYNQLNNLMQEGLVQRVDEAKYIAVLQE